MEVRDRVDKFASEQLGVEISHCNPLTVEWRLPAGTPGTSRRPDVDASAAYHQIERRRYF